MTSLRDWLRGLRSDRDRLKRATCDFCGSVGILLVAGGACIQFGPGVGLMLLGAILTALAVFALLRF